MPDALSTLTDARFQIVEDADSASIFWLVGPGRNQYKANAVLKDGYLNEFPNDDTLLVKDLFIPLLHSSYKCFSKEASEDSQPARVIQEAYMANTQLPAFAGRFYEREALLEDNTWAVIAGQIPQGAPVIPSLTKSVDWAMRLTETGPCGSIIQKY